MKYDFETLRPRVGVGASKWAELEADGVADPTVVPLSVADMELPVAPEIQAALIEQAKFGIYGYTHPTQAYNQAVVGWMSRRHGWEIDPSWMVQSYGVVTAIGAAVAAFTTAEECVIVQSPVYYPFTNKPAQLGRKVLRNPLRRTEAGYEMDFDNLEELASRPDAKLLLLCSPHNPIGRVWKREELERLADICQRNGVVVFADEIHCDFVYPGHKHIPFATLSDAAAQNCIVGTAASKSFNLAGLSTSNIIIPNPALREKFTQALSAMSGFFNNFFGLAATQAAYDKGEAWLDALLEHIYANYEYVSAFLAENIPDAVVAPLEGTYLMWVDFSCLELTAQARKEFMVHTAKLYLDEGELFGEESAGWERINLACPRSGLEAAMARLKAAVDLL